MRVLLIAALLALASVPTTVRAQDAQLSATDEEARGLFNAGEAAFSDARYEDALRYFRDAYRLSGRPGLLYNIGVAADRLRRDQEALEAFERFLAESPPGTRQRQDAEARVRVLREAVARGEQAAPSTASTGDGASAQGDGAQGAASTSSAPSAGGGDATVGWIVLGAGAAVAVVGAVLLGVGQADASSVESAPDGTPWLDVADAASRADLLRNLGWVFLGVGVAGAVAGLTLAIIEGGSGSGERATLELVPGGLRLSGSF